jgi:hypothetical protein
MKIQQRKQVTELEPLLHLKQGLKRRTHETERISADRYPTMAGSIVL